MFKKLLIVVAVILSVVGGMAAAQGRPISGQLPWNNSEAEPILQERVEQMFPDGTDVDVLNEALAAERFSMVSDNRGISTPRGDGNRFASRQVVRLVFGCSTRVALRWEQLNGQVFNMEGNMHQGCL